MVIKLASTYMQIYFCTIGMFKGPERLCIYG